MEEFAYLSPINDQKTGVSTGFYKCSLCKAVLSPTSRDSEQMAINFAMHVAHVHQSHKARIESISETAAWVVEEAIQRLPKRKSERGTRNWVNTVRSI